MQSDKSQRAIGRSVGEQITIEGLTQNPYPLFQKMLAHEPVCWVPAFKMWMITRREDVVEILRDAETYTMEPEGGQINPMEDTFGPMMLSIDGPEHKKIRDLFSEPFRARPVRHNYRHIIAADCTTAGGRNCPTGNG